MLMDEFSPTLVPLGSLAVLFAGVTILIFIRKMNLSRQADKAIERRMNAKRKEKNYSLSEQKKRLEILLKK